jgi:hypothetical protein
MIKMLLRRLSLGKVDLSKINLKEVAGSDLKILEFRSTEDTEINDTLNAIKPILVEGDTKFKEKNYSLMLAELSRDTKTTKESQR